MFFSSVTNRPAVITTNSNLENFNKVQNSESDVNEPKVMSNFGKNLSELSLRTSSTEPLNEDKKGHLSDNMTKISNIFVIGSGGKIQSSDSYLCGLPAQTLDRFVFINL